jgi:hypothetical protein
MVDDVTVDGNATDPNGVYTFQMLDPQGRRTEYIYLQNDELVRDDLGVYHVDWLIATHGEYRYRFVAGDGAAEGANEGIFKVTKSAFE